MSENRRYELWDTHDGHSFIWELKLYPEGGPHHPNIHCPSCGGHGKTNMMFGALDEPEFCSPCNGTGRVRDPNWRWAPTPPPELVEVLRKTVREYWNKVQNDNFTLTPSPNK